MRENGFASDWQSVARKNSNSIGFATQRNERQFK